MNDPQKEPCQRCKGCGQVANTKHGEPWVEWLDAPPNIVALVTMAVVRPIPCPHCNGRGRR